MNHDAMTVNRPPSVARIEIALGDRSYPIDIGRGLIARDDLWAPWAKASTSALIVSNSTVGPLHGGNLQAALERHFRRVLRLDLPDGEGHKTWETLQRVFDLLLAQGGDRKTLLVALGGGVVGDLTGFAAACFMRGVPYVQVPTTLLAQVDSSVGGKTAINHPLGKNMIGAFYQPVHVVCDLDTLATLPDREFRAGLAEVIKYGPIYDAEFFAWLEANMTRLLSRDAAALVHAVQRSCEIKAEVVGQDEREGGLRAILNFGHTFGHAIETGFGYGRYLHGEAVAMGMVVATRLSQRLGRVDVQWADRIVALIDAAGLAIRAPAMAAAQWLSLMRVDKKAEAGEIRYVLLDGRGKALVQAVADDVVVECITACTDTR